MNKSCPGCQAAACPPPAPPAPANVPFAFGRGHQFVNEQERRPAPRTPVLVAVMRRAHLVPDGRGGHRWELLNPHEPIDLDLDTVYWLPPGP